MEAAKSNVEKEGGGEERLVWWYGGEGKRESPKLGEYVDRELQPGAARSACPSPDYRPPVSRTHVSTVDGWTGVEWGILPL